MLVLVTAVPAGAALIPRDLRCEYRREPAGIESARPFLSWALESAARGERQRAYQVLAASSGEKLAAKVAESGGPASKAKGVRLLREENGAAVFEIESGEYRFLSREFDAQRVFGSKAFMDSGALRHQAPR